MNKTYFLKHFITSLILLSAAFSSKADRFSYVYIQGDKQTPFYVKLENDMLPRFSKNYCIIPQLAPGPVHLQILFQQNQYPAQSFYIQVPPDGYRGFLLTKVDNGFALYDVQQRFYLMPGEQSEDHLPELPASGSALQITENEATAPPVKKAAAQKTKTVSQQPSEKIVEVRNVPAHETSGSEPQFMDVELSNERKPVSNEVTIQETPASETDIAAENNNVQEKESEVPQNEEPLAENIPAPATSEVNIADERAVEETGMHNTEAEMSEPVPELIENAAPVINSDCPDPLSQGKFDDIFITSRAKSGDDKRIGYLMKKAGENCFTTRQAFLLSRQLQAESMRYSFLKKIYPHITDQQNFPLLADALFKTLEWKSYFKLIYEP